MNRAAHWDEVYRTRVSGDRSWSQRRADVSLELIEEAFGEGRAAVLDVGGGASPLAGDLLARGFGDVTVVDLAEPALVEARAALGSAGGGVRWVVGDVLRLPLRRACTDLWHDRAVFHFLTRAEERARYRAEVRRVLRRGGFVVVATFAADGPSRCSGLPVSRYSVDALHHALGRDLEALSWRRELHRTPSGGVQPFTYGLFRCPARGGEPDEGGSAGEAPDRRDGSEPPR